VPSETAISQAADNIFSSYVGAGNVKDANEDEMILRVIKTLIRICSILDKDVKSDEEIS
jgi:hypothetical protein